MGVFFHVSDFMDCHKYCYGPVQPSLNYQATICNVNTPITVLGIVETVCVIVRVNVSWAGQ